MVTFEAPTFCGKLRFVKKRSFGDGGAIWEATTPWGAISLRSRDDASLQKYASAYQFPCPIRSGEAASRETNCSECNSRYDYQVIPQFDSSTGRCWWTALVAALTYSVHLRRVFGGALEAVASDAAISAFRGLVSGVHERATAQSELLRRYMYEKWGVGDAPWTAREHEGGNARVEMLKLFAALSIPYATLYWKGDGFVLDPSYPASLGEANPRVLVVSTSRKSEPWVPSAELRVSRAPGAHPDPSGAWRLQAILVGNEDAGHQLSMSTCDGNVCEWMLADSDAALLGITSTWLSCPREEEWVDMLAAQLPMLTRAPGRGASFAPSNRSGDCTAFPETCDTPGMTNVDFLYTRI